MNMAKMIIEGYRDYKITNIKGQQGKLQSEFVWNTEGTECSRTMDSNELIKETCWKVNINRIGEIESIITQEGIKIIR